MGFFSSKKAEMTDPSSSSIPADRSKEIRLSDGIETSIGTVSLSSKSTGDPEDISRMRVVVRYSYSWSYRIRPFNTIETQSKLSQTPTVQSNHDDKTLQIYNADGKVSAMSFNRVYSDSCDQQSFFETSGAVEMISQSLKGYLNYLTKLYGDYFRFWSNWKWKNFQ